MRLTSATEDLWAVTEDVPQVIVEIDEVMRLIPQERIQQRTVEVVKEMMEVDQVIPQSASSTEMVMCQEW